MENNNKLYNILAYLGILFLVGLISAPNDQDVKFHVNQGIVLSIGEVALTILSTILAFTIIIPILCFIAGCVLVVFAIMGIINASKGEQKELPLIGKIKILK